MVPVGCVDSGLADALNLEVEAGTTYYIKVGQYQGGNDAGTVDFAVAEGTLPLEPAKLVIESSANNTSTVPVRDIVAALEARHPPPHSREMGVMLLLRFRALWHPLVRLPKTKRVLSVQNVPGGGLVKWNGPADLLQVFEGPDNDSNFSDIWVRDYAA